VLPIPEQLDAHRELVAQEFDKLLGGGEKSCKGRQLRRTQGGTRRPRPP
jgi:hypothetical protein